MKQYLPILLVIFGTLVGVWSAWPDVMSAPNEVMMGRYGDAIKNYYTPSYYVKYDDGLQFTGMQYPYGEHVTYTDNQPLLSWILAGINSFIPIENHTIGIINMLMLLGIVFCAILVYAIQRRFGVGAWWAALISILIALMNPQVQRIEAHFALSYAWVVPLVWLLLLNAIGESKRLLWQGLLVLTITLLGFIHPYYLAIGSLFTLAFGGVLLLRELFNKRLNLFAWLPIFIAGVLPIILFKLFGSLTDPVADRLSDPFGFLFYHAKFETVFWAGYGPMQEFWYLLTKIKVDKWEGRAYVGIVGGVVLLFVAAGILLKIAKRKWSTLLNVSDSAELVLSVWAATIMLLFACAFPFKMPQLQGLVEHLGPLKQFRSLGRFAWIFYYVYTVFVSAFLWKYIKQLLDQKLRKIAIGIGAVVILVWAAEAIVHLKIHAEKERSQNIFQQEELTDEIKTFLNTDADQYQAILPIPYFHIGSEKYSVVGDGRTEAAVMTLSEGSGIPLAATMMSRTSVSQTTSMLSLTQTIPWLDIPYLDEINEKPLFILQEKHLPQRAYEERWISLADTLGENDVFRWLKLDPQELRKDVQHNKRIILNKLENNISDSTYFYKSYNKETGLPNINGGSHQIIQDEFLIIIDEAIDTTYAITGMWRASAWIYLSPGEVSNPHLEYLAYNEYGQEIYRVTKQGRITDIQGDWGLAILDFDADKAVRHVIKAGGPARILDELLVRPIDATIIQEDKRGIIRVNTIPFPNKQ